MTGLPLPADELPEAAAIAPVGDVTVRVVSSFPNLSGLFRLDQVVAEEARQTLWLTDAYFVATTLYVQALRSAAADGVDVRVLVPGATDIPGLRALSRSGYRALLEGGIRVFEWNGPMLHAKTAVADGRWARVGSTNLNPVSWLGNWELDVAIENREFAEKMEEMYLDDLRESTEVVLSRHQRVKSIAPAPRPARRRRQPRRIGRATAGAIGIGSAIGAATGRRRPLGPAEAKVLTAAGLMLIGLVIAALIWPHLIVIPLSIVGTWFSIALLTNAWRLHRKASLDAGVPSSGGTEDARRASAGAAPGHAVVRPRRGIAGVAGGCRLRRFHHKSVSAQAAARLMLPEIRSARPRTPMARALLWRV